MIQGTQTRHEPSWRLDEGLQGLVVEYMPLVKFVALRIWQKIPSSVDLEDLEHAGMLGLMEAACRFDPTHDNLFKTYAEHRIRGAILDELRRSDWMTRTSREKSKLLGRTVGEFEKAFKRVPTSDEVATALGMSLEQYFSFLNDPGTAMSTLVDQLPSKGDTRESFGLGAASPAESKIWLEQVTRLIGEEMQRLKAEERQVLSLYYYDEMKMKEIGRYMGLTESRISQIHQTAMGKLLRTLPRRLDVVNVR